MATHPPAWLIYPGAVLTLLLAAFGARPDENAPAPPPALPAAEGAVLAQTTPFDVLSVRRVRRGFGGEAASAFSVGDGGVWLTIGDLARDCPHPAVTIGGGQGVIAKARPGPIPDLAVLTTPGGAPALPIAPTAPTPGALAYVAGYPHGRPGEVALQLLGLETLYLPGRGHHALLVSTWAEVGRTDGISSDLQGLAGAPVLDAGGRVVGVVLGEAPRRGRLYAAPLAAVAQALTAAGVRAAPTAAGQQIGADNYGLAADDLRRSYQVIPAVCAAAR
jgi:hypothetical protein